MHDILLRNEAETADFGRRLAMALKPGDVVALRGGLGAGKTALVRGALKELGLEGEAPSPTFAIVQPYAPPELRMPVAHVDLYRLDDPEEAEELGLDDYLIDGALLVEWPERMGTRLWSFALILDLAVTDEGARRLTATVPPSWKDRWPLP